MAGRRAKRFRSYREIAVAIQAPGTRFSGYLVDISTTGILVRCSQDLERDTLGRLAIDIGYATIRAVGIVRRHVADVGLAFEFRRMGAHDRDLLRRLLSLLSK